MAYNNYGYTGFNPYYPSQSQDPNHTQSPATHTQAYQNSSNPYSQYPYNANQYAHQSSDRTHQQYQTKSSIENPGFQSSYGYPQQQYTSTTRNDTSTGYQTYATANQTSNAAYPYNTQSTLDQNNKSFQDNSALSGLAYASTLGTRSASTINNVPTTSQLYQQQQQSQQQVQQQQSQSQTQQSQQPQQQVQQPPQQPQQTQSSSSILPNPTHQQSYGQTNSQKTHATPQMPQQSLYRSNVNNQQRVAPAATQIRRSPSLPVKQQSISQQGSSKVMSPHPSIVGQNSSRPSFQSSNAHQISTIMNQSQDHATAKGHQAPTSQIHTQVQNHVQVDERSPANTLQSPAITEIQTINPSAVETINPIAVFDHAEWARRTHAQKKAQEDAEAAKRIKEHKIPAPIQPPPPPVAQPVQPTQAPVPQQSTPKISTPDQSKSIKQKEPIPEDEIRAEMKAFAEKLRTWKSRDSSGNVDEMWRQTLQGTNNSFLLGTRISSQTPQLSRTSVPGKSTPKLDTSAISPGYEDSIALGSPFQGSGGEEIQDRGKFPAMRRRTRADKGVSRSAKAGQVAAARAITQASPPSATSHLGKVTPLTATTPLDAGAESMRRAMQAFHQTPTPVTPDPSTPITQPKVKMQSTVWPEEQKPQLSETAKAFLESQPANKGKQIAVEEIMNMLNTNPSYDQLCIMLATRGFAVPRALFAQELLDVVPSGRSKNSVNTANTDDTPAKKPRGRPKKTSIATPIESPVVPQATNGAPMSWGGNPIQSNIPTSDGKTSDLTNGEGAEYAPFYEKMRLISGQSPAQTQSIPPQMQPGKKRNIGELGKGMEVNGASMGKKQQIDRPGVVKNPGNIRPK